MNFVSKKTDNDFYHLIIAIDAILQNLSQTRLLPTDVIFGEPDQKQKCDIFIVMAFARRFNLAYKSFQKAVTQADVLSKPKYSSKRSIFTRID